MFTVFTADMVEKKGVPPGKNGKKKQNFDVYRFCRGYGREKRGAPPVKTVKTNKTVFAVFTTDMVEKKGAPPR